MRLHPASLDEILALDPDMIMIAESRARIRERGLYEFGRQAFPHITGRPMIETWHLEVIAEYLEAVYRFDIRRLVMNVPPGTGKSIWIGVIFPAWVWSMSPERRSMYSSFDDGLVLRDARATRNLVNSTWYQARWGAAAVELFGLEGPGTEIDATKTAAAKAGEYWTTAGGLRFSSTIRSKGTGWHAEYQIVDDPSKAKDATATAPTAMHEVNDWYDETMSSRRLPGSQFARVVNMQRLSRHDLSEHCLGKGTYEHLCLPMKAYATGHRYQSKHDRRTEEGEFLCPALKDAEAVEEEARELGHSGAQAQHQQDPEDRGGGVFKDEWCVNFWTRLPSGCRFVDTADLTFGSISKGASSCSFQKWADKGGDRYLVDRRAGPMEYPAMKAKGLAFYGKAPHSMTKLVEDAAAGRAFVQDLRHDVSGLELVRVDGGTGGKLTRATAATGPWAAGNVYLPHPTDARLPDGTPHPCPWVSEYIEKITAFKGLPGDEADDVDAMSQYMNWIEGKGSMPAWAQRAKNRISHRKKGGEK